jgi:UDP-N-acetylglucosamine 2-epimerase (non-hydrolysing)
MKIAPIMAALDSAIQRGATLEYILVHTGQHYDEKMSETFFRELEIPMPQVNLACGGGSQAVQTASIMMRFEEHLLQHPTDLVLVVGDVTSTMACAIVAQKLHTPVAHVEAGIRSNDWSMPEEINRLVTDSICNYFYTTTPEASQTLMRSGVSEERIQFVGNTMIDTLLKNKHRFKKPSWFTERGLSQGAYLVITLHRPSNVDDPNHLQALLEEIVKHSRGVPLVFPVHPRTRKNLGPQWDAHPQLILCDPMGYLEFNYLVEHSMAVITDSGGITEETTVMQIPCMTLRNSTERPETCTLGTNELIGTSIAALQPALERLFAGNWKKGSIPEKWDGHAAERIVEHIVALAHQKL